MRIVLLVISVLVSYICALTHSISVLAVKTAFVSERVHHLKNLRRAETFFLIYVFVQLVYGIGVPIFYGIFHGSIFYGSMINALCRDIDFRCQSLRELRNFNSQSKVRCPAATDVKPRHLISPAR